MQENKVKPLKDLRLLDRFLFAEVMDDPECSKEVLEIIHSENPMVSFTFV